MKTNEWIAVIAVIVVVAVIVSIATVSLTGNVIKVQPVINGTSIYTKAEVDNMFKLGSLKNGSYGYKEGYFNATGRGHGSSFSVNCPTGKKAISGGCSVDGYGTQLMLSGFSLTRTSSTLDYYNAYSCSFTALEKGLYAYQVFAFCV